ncbi:MAG: LysM peptidoglycan-binding domain-containing protein [Candidatus Marithrix sp.]|nr:LysM peptidoglycan-binding domain-containing protein [Candidatus Marithrix sp.]
MKSTIKLCFLLSGLILFQACTTPNQKPSNSQTQQPFQYVEHIVKPGENIVTIASLYGCNDYRELAVANGLYQSYDIYTGQKMSVPSNICDRVAELHPRLPMTLDFHTVVQGDNLYDIAQKYGISLANLTTWNRLEPPYNLLIGQQLRVIPLPERHTISSFTPQPIRASRPSTRQTSKRIYRKSSRHHTVSKGENLYRISLRYGYSVSEIARWNNIPKPYTLSIGKRLIVSPPR